MGEGKLSEEEVEQKMKELEENPPQDLDDWPADKQLRNATFGGPEGEHGYDEGAEKNLGPSDLQHYPDRSVTIGGEEVDNPEDYKGEPIPGGPTDEETPHTPGQTEEKAAGEDHKEAESAQ